MHKSIRSKMKQWKDQIGHKRAVKLLVKRGISLSMATKLLSDYYDPNPKIESIRKIEKAMGGNKCE